MQVVSKLTACLLTTALVGQTSATEPSLQEPASQAKLLLRADVAATLVLDGAPAGDVAAGEIRELRLLRGSHRVALVTQGGELRWQEPVSYTHLTLPTILRV